MLSCFDTATLVTLTVMVGFPTAGLCFGIIVIWDGRGRIWPWWLLLFAVACGCTVLGLTIDRPACELRRLIAANA